MKLLFHIFKFVYLLFLILILILYHQEGTTCAQSMHLLVRNLYNYVQYNYLILIYARTCTCYTQVLVLLKSQKYFSASTRVTWLCW